MLAGRSALGAVQKNHGTRLAKHIEIRPGNDLDCEEETLVVRQAMLKAAIEEKMREIRLMQEKNEFKSWGRLNFEVDVKMVEGERCGEELVKVGENGNGFGLDDGKVVKAELGHERCKLDGLKSSGVGNGEAHVVAELEGERVNVFAEKKRLAGEPSKKDGLGASGMEILTACLLTICILECYLKKLFEVMALRSRKEKEILIKILNMIMV